MRVAMKYGCYRQPCQTFNDREVEDYSIEVLVPSSGLISNDKDGDPTALADEKEEEESEFDINKNVLTVYPNPTTELLNMRLSNFLSGQATIYIHNTLGQEMTRKMITHNAEGEIQFDVSAYGEGIYILTVELEGGEKVSKQFVVVR